MPRISVCIPTFNYGRYLRDAVESVLAQTRGDLELVVVDNCSTDDTPQIVQEFMARDRRVRYVRNDVNVGPQRNLSRCIEVAEGEIVNVLCADDVLEPTAIEKLARPLEERPDLALAGCARQYVGEDLRPLFRMGFSRGSEMVPGVEAVRRCLASGNLIGEPSAVLFRKSAAARGFDASYRQLVDAEMWFHLLRSGGYAFVAEPLCKVRKHGAAETRRNVESLVFVSEFLELAREYAGDRVGLVPRGWRMNVALDVWGMQLRGLPIAEAHRAIRKVCPLPLFYLALPFNVPGRIALFVRERAPRWRAALAGR